MHRETMPAEPSKEQLQEYHGVSGTGEVLAGLVHALERWEARGFPSPARKNAADRRAPFIAMLAGFFEKHPHYKPSAAPHSKFYELLQYILPDDGDPKRQIEAGLRHLEGWKRMGY